MKFKVGDYITTKSNYLTLKLGVVLIWQVSEITESGYKAYLCNEQIYTLITEELARRSYRLLTDKEKLELL